VRDIVNFYESLKSSLRSPAYSAVLEEVLKFRPLGQYETIGNLSQNQDF
jgi:hypothetical protein